MTRNSFQKDLIVLVADADAEQLMQVLLDRAPQFFGIRKINYDIKRHSNRDNGVYNNAEEFLRLFLRDYQYALVVFDLEGSGQEKKDWTQVAKEVRERLCLNGWKERAEVVVFSPEVEIWLWSKYSLEIIEDIVRWELPVSIKEFLEEKGFWEKSALKPFRPKEALEKVLYEVRYPRTQALYGKVVQQMPVEIVKECQDRAFQRLVETFYKWFT